ncbi:ionotropic glutamate receptor [Plakobranchus ocellatus]|uniref:Ionotropic glutamate receptor n=1 Tax=Plakobranchus ocellatus TaxID=259542 RepID=A0AAV3YY44_9GAST|nr:ionotropic glutamate receptor [Plakobranchus ocellatus]
MPLTVNFIIIIAVIYWGLQNSNSSKFTSKWRKGDIYDSNFSGVAFSANAANQENTTLIYATFLWTAKWARLVLEAREVMDYMYASQKQNQSSISNTQKTLLFILSADISTVMHRLHSNLWFSNRSTKIIVFEVSELCSRQKVLEILLAAVNMEEQINGVVVASSHENVIKLFLDTMATEPAFKWRRFRHMTEWIVMLADPPRPNSGGRFRPINHPDFVTFLSVSERNGYFKINIAQSSRTTSMATGPQLSFLVKSPSLKESQSIDPFSYLDQTPQPLLNLSILTNHLRRNAALYLSTKKSVMADMIIPAVFHISEPDKTAFFVRKGKETTWAGFNVDILHFLTEALGFIALPFAVTDGGFYGLYKPNGDVLGVVGYLFRRESGLTTMAMHSTAKRLEAVDFVYPSLRESHMGVMYKVDSERSQLGDLQSELVRTETDLLVVLIGPCVALISGVFVYLVNGVLVNRRNVMGRKNLKRLYDFPLYSFFQTTELCRHQSGRILRASWGFFCITLFASYAALMTSNVAAPVERPVISSLENLLSHPEIAIGISPANSQMITALRTASTGTPYAHIWEKLVRLNRSDARTFNPDKGYHIKRVLQGNYAYIGNVPEGLLPSCVDQNADFSHVRFFELNCQQLYMALPHNVFYKADIERALLFASEIGTIKSIFDKWVPPEANMDKSEVEKHTVVHLDHLKLLFTFTAYGIGFAFLSLVIEISLRLGNVVRL